MRNKTRSLEAREKPTSYGVANHAKSVTISIKDIFDLLTWVQRESTATIKHPPQAYTHASPPKKQNIMEFDCRGLEFTEFKSDVCRGILTVCAVLLTAWQGEWQAKGLESPTKFSGIDLQEGEWFDYDEKAGEEVSIKDLKWEVRRA